MDGKVFPMSKYEVGSTAPPFHPWCRCCTAPYFEDMKGIGERFARDPETGKTYTVPKDMTYKEWKAKQDEKLKHKDSTLKGVTPREFVAAGEKAENDSVKKALAFHKQKKTPEQKETSTPDRISIVTEEYLQRKGNPDGHYEIPEGYDLSKHRNECTMAEWISRNFGGTIRLLNESSVPGEKTADYEWDGRLWELKTASSVNAVDAALRKAVKQIYSNPGGVIIDFIGKDTDYDAVLEAAKHRMSRWRFEGTIDAIFTSDEKTLFVVRIKK